MTLLNIFDTLNIAGITVSSSLTGNECLYNLLTVEDNAILTTIKGMDNIYDLSRNEEALNYVEKLILAFVTLSDDQTIQYTNCLETILDGYECDNHNVSEGPIDLIRELVKLPVNTENYTEEEINKVVNRIVIYIPDIIKIILKISENFENNKCGRVSYNTKVLKIINNKIIKNNSVDFSFPDIGFNDFFNGFQDNIISKSILLLFIAFIIGKIIGLFNVQYNINK
tara:strand:- start:3759 stop:4436 length:678 start_codon:yes stop_codon:yes gene_type:complete